MFKHLKLLPISLVSIASVAAVNSAYAASGFFVGGSVNVQQNAYSKSGVKANKAKSNLSALNSGLTIEEIKSKLNDLKVENSKLAKENIELSGLRFDAETEFKDGKLTLEDYAKKTQELNAKQKQISEQIRDNNKDIDRLQKLQKAKKEAENGTSEGSSEKKPTTEDEKEELDNNITDNAKTKEEKANEESVASIKSSASRIEPSISLLAGYGVKHNNFGFITEAGIDLNFGKVGDNSKQELEVKNVYNIYLAQKAGYYFNENNLTYVTGGLSIKDTKVSYKNEINEKKVLANLIIGVGYERTLTNNLAIFTEFNHIFSLGKVATKAGDVKTRSEQVRIGARYYF